jgi:hypothetical protein
VPVPACVFISPKGVAEKNVKSNSVCFSKSPYSQKKGGGFRCNSVEWNEKVIDIRRKDKMQQRYQRKLESASITYKYVKVTIHGHHTVPRRKGKVKLSL